MLRVDARKDDEYGLSTSVAARGSCNALSTRLRSVARERRERGQKEHKSKESATVGRKDGVQGHRYARHLVDLAYRRGLPRPDQTSASTRMQEILVYDIYNGDEMKEPLGSIKSKPT